MQNNWKYMVLILLSAAALLLMIRFFRQQSQDYKTKIEIENLRKNKDSLFILADQIVDSVEEDKRIKECQIDSLKYKLANQKEVVRTNTVYVNNGYDEEKKVVLSSSVDTRALEQDLKRKEEMIYALTQVNHGLRQQIDSLQMIVDKIKN